MTMTALPSELTLSVDASREIDAPVEAVFDAILEQLGPNNSSPEGHDMNLVLEPHPGGRWYRDLGSGQGHLWGHVQVIKRPALLEITGPMFMSYPALSHIQFRVSERDGGGALLEFRHQALGMIEQAHREGVQTGWNHMLDGVAAASVT